MPITCNARLVDVGARREPRDSPPLDDTPSVGRSVWTGLLAAAGAVATLAGLLYFVGAVSLWIALRNRGYSPDVAIAHQPRTQLIAIGIRGGIVVVAIGVALLAVSLSVARIGRVRAVAKRTRFRYACAAAFALLLAASFVSWRWLALAIGVSTLLVQNAAQLRFPSRWKHRYWIGVLVPATMAAIAWVAGGIVRVSTVEITPPSKTPLVTIHVREATCNSSPGYANLEESLPLDEYRGCEKPEVECRTRYAVLEGKWVPIAEYNECKNENALSEAAIKRRLKDMCDVPYFGESESLIYVGAINNVVQTAGRACRWDAGPLVELRRDEVLLSFRPRPGFLGVSRTRPIRTALDAVANFFRGVDARLLPE